MSVPAGVITAYRFVLLPPELSRSPSLSPLVVMETTAAAELALSCTLTPEKTVSKKRASSAGQTVVSAFLQRLAKNDKCSCTLCAS